MTISETIRSYEWLRAMLWHVADSCDKACGCGHCVHHFLDYFAFGDSRVYWIR